MSEQTYRDVLSRLEEKDKKPMTIDEAYDALSFLPGTGETIAAYELPGVLSQAKTLMQDPDALKALAGLGLGALGTAAVAPGIGPFARGAKKGLEGFIPYLQPKLAPAGGPDTSKVLMSGDDGDDLFSLPPASGTYEPGEKKFIKGLNQEIYKLTDKSLFDPAKKAGRKLVIVSCSQKKCPDVGNMNAFDRYMGSVFQSLKKQGVPEDVDVAILSAKHGLISRDTPIKNYDLKMSSEIGQKFKSDPTQMNRILNTMTGYDDVIVQGGPLYKDVIRAAAGKGDINLTEVPPGGGIGTQRSDLVKLIKGEDIGKGKNTTQKLTDEDYIKQLEDMGINDRGKIDYASIENDADEIIVPAVENFGLRDVLKVGEGLKGAERKRAISDKIDEMKLIFAQHKDYANKIYLENASYAARAKSDNVRKSYEFRTRQASNREVSAQMYLDNLEKLQKNILGNAYDKSKKGVQAQNYQGGVFAKIDTPVYHYTKKAKEGFTKFKLPDDDPDPLSVLGIHVGSTPKAAIDRYVATVYGPAVKTYYRQGMDLDTAIKKTEKEYGADQIIYNEPGKDISPGSVPLKADLSKPFLNPETKKPFTESELFRLLEKPDDVMDTVIYERTVDNAKELRKLLSKKGFTHIPYVNDFEDAGNLSYIMLVDRPVNSTKVLQSPFAKKNPSAANDPDFMKAEGGVVEMKDKAVNMYRDTQGIEPFIKYMV